MQEPQHEKGRKVTEALKSAMFLYLSDTDQTRMDLAKKLGCAHPTVVNWISGRTKRITPQWWAKLKPILTNHFGPKFETMLRSENPALPGNTREAGTPLPSSKAMVLAWIYDTLPPTDQERFDVELREAEYKYRAKHTNPEGGKKGKR
jgi:hypothetical protein